ncbi:hypothetical protein E3J79_00285 [Candidatus Dependentiae bacterium]|nr:MAG: hypothetical protein E3J79_00285 [Candidatus Dependentiae bacterium]
MPLYKGHLLGGFVSGVSLLFLLSKTVYSLPAITALEWLLCALAGSLFPDVDTKSKGQKYFYWLIGVLMLLSLYKGHLYCAVYLVLFSILPLIVRHRGLFHCTWFLIVVPLGAAAIASVYLPVYRCFLFYDAAFFIVGALSHLLMDFGFKGLMRMR